MSNLTQLLLQPQFQGLSDADALALGNVVSLYQPLHILYSYSGVGEILQSASVDSSILLNVPGYIKALIGGPSLDVFLLSGGVDFSLVGIRQYLKANLTGTFSTAPTIGDVALLAMLSAGGVEGTLWQQYSITQPLVTDITAARSLIASANDKQSFADLYNQAVANMDAGSMTLAQAKAFMSGS